MTAPTPTLLDFPFRESGVQAITGRETCANPSKVEVGG